MRHFSQISERDIYVTRKGGGVFARGTGSQEPIVAALARCLEVSVLDAQRYFVSGESDRLAPAECRALDDFLAFSKQVAEGLDAPEGYGSAVTFFYVNLNTGKSVSWTHIFS